MAKLQEYVPDSTKSGYYLRGYDGTSNTTFQVGRLATQIIKWLKISPGERLPNDLLWKFYELGLINTGEQSQIKRSEFENDFTRAGSNNLTQKQAIRLRQFITDYDSINSGTVKQLESLVEGVEYEEPINESVRFAEKNPLSDIAEDVHTRESLLNQAYEIIDKYEVSKESTDFFRSYPKSVLAAIPRMSNAYFDLIELEVSRSKLVYTFYDEEMWNGEEMVETKWKLSDVRGTSVDRDFEAGFDVEAHYSGASAQTQIHIRNGNPDTFQLTTNWEEENVDLVYNSPIKSRYDGFYKHICNCLNLQLELLPEYNYNGPEPSFER